MVQLTNNARIIINIKNHIENLELQEIDLSDYYMDNDISFSSYCYKYKNNLLNDIAARLDDPGDSIELISSKFIDF